jgi:hypothetical protein
MKQIKKILFLLLILLSSTNFMNLSGLEILPYDIINLLLSLYFVSYSFFKKKIWSAKYFKTTTVFIKLFCIAFILSAITAYLDWNQGFFITFVASRSLLWLSFGFYLIKSKTTFNEVIAAFSYFTWIYLILSLLIAVIPELKPQLIYLDEVHAHKIDESIFYGLIFTLIPFYISLDKLISRFKLSKIELTQFILTFIVIILSESRASLFPILILIIIAYVFNSKYNFFQKFLIIFLLSTFSVYFVVDKIVPLFNETLEHVNDNNYPRIRGIVFYSNSFSKSNLGYFLGNSIGSKKVYYGQYLDKLKIRDGLYISDLGLFGTWVYFGVLSVLAIFTAIFKIFKSSSKFRAFKYLGLHIIFGWTYFLFLPQATFVFFISILYMFDYKTIQNNIEI